MEENSQSHLVNSKVQSEYLKGVYPSGFNLNKVRGANRVFQNHTFPSSQTQVLVPGATIEQASIDTSDKYRVGSPISFMAWTRGNSIELSQSVEDEKGDPYADVAGPFFGRNSLKDRGGRGSKKTLDRISTDAVKDMSSEFVKTSAMPIHRQRMKGVQKVANGSNSPGKVFQPPGVLAPLKNRNNNNGDDDSLFDTTLNYDEWLKSNRQNSLSTYSFGQFSGSGTVNVPSFRSDTVPYCPKQVANQFDIMVHSFKDMMGSTKVNTIAEYRIGSISTDVKLKAIKTLISKKMYSDGAEGGLGPRNTIELYYFNEPLNSWRQVSNESDWLQAKTHALDLGQPLQIMFSMRKEFELEAALRKSTMEMPTMTSTSDAQALMASGNMTNKPLRVLLHEDSQQYSRSIKVSQIPLSASFGSEEPELRIKSLMMGSRTISNNVNINHNPSHTFTQAGSNWTRRTSTQPTMPTLSNYPPTAATTAELTVSAPKPISPRPQSKGAASFLMDNMVVNTEKQDQWALELESRLLKTRW